MTVAFDFTTPHLIRSEKEYDLVVVELRRLLDKNPKAGSRSEERIEFLSVLVADFDRKHHRLPGGAVTPQQVVTFMLEQRGMERSELASVMGGRARVSQFFSGQRALSMRQLLALRALFGIPADFLIDESATLARKPQRARTP